MQIVQIVLAWLTARLREPSTYSGIGQALAGVAIMFHSTVAGQLADQFTEAANAPPGLVGGLLLITGALSAALKEGR